VKREDFYDLGRQKVRQQQSILVFLSCLLLSTSSFLTLVCLVSSSSFRLRVQIIQSYSGALYKVASSLMIQEEEEERRGRKVVLIEDGASRKHPLFELGELENGVTEFVY